MKNSASLRDIFENCIKFVVNMLKCFRKSHSPLREKTLLGVSEYILSNECSRIVTMAGAGISTAAGIPDFRSQNAGIYKRLQSYGLPYPEAVFEIRHFINNPKPFFQLCKEFYPKYPVYPTLTHYFIKLINDKGLLLRHYTQNVDSLERKTGLPEDKLIEVHGTFTTSHCMECHMLYNLVYIEQEIRKGEIPYCWECGNVVKPDIILFGENLPSEFFRHMVSDFKECDLLLILGSTLSVEPFASLVRTVGKRCPRIVINRTIPKKRGMQFHSTNSKDVLWIGDCDEGCTILAQHLNWWQDLMNLMNENPKPSSFSTM